VRDVTKLVVVSACVPQEHKCVLDSCRVLEQEGFEVTYLPVQKNGIIRLEVCNIALYGVEYILIRSYKEQSDRKLHLSP